MSLPVLYKLVTSPPACSVRIVADMLGVQYDTKQVDYMAREHKSPEYLKMNPMGTIPVWKEDDFVLSESHAIVKYLIAKHGPHPLYPEDIRVRAIIDQCMYFNIGVFFVKSDVVILTILADKKSPTPKQLADIDLAYGTIEMYLENRKYIAADHLTLADISVGTTAVFTQLVRKIDPKRFPRTVEWLARLEKEPMFSKYSVPGVAEFKEILAKQDVFQNEDQL